MEQPPKPPKNCLESHRTKPNPTWTVAITSYQHNEYETNLTSSNNLKFIAVTLDFDLTWWVRKEWNSSSVVCKPMLIIRGFVGPSPQVYHGYVHISGSMEWLCDELSRPNKDYTFTINTFPYLLLCSSLTSLIFILAKFFLTILTL